jgi:anti-sigma regulatory factor (Ser/Thr protein kinase)
MPDDPPIRVPAKSTAWREIRIGNRIPEIGRVAALVDSFGADHKLSSEVIVALNVSLDEILNNIISYGYDDAGHHEILVQLILHRDTVEVVVEDDGKPFNPLLVPAPDFDAERRNGGVGLHFVRNLTDQQKYARRDRVNQLRLKKKLEQ